MRCPRFLGSATDAGGGGVAAAATALGGTFTVIVCPVTAPAGTATVKRAPLYSTSIGEPADTPGGTSTCTTGGAASTTAAVAAAGGSAAAVASASSAADTSRPAPPMPAPTAAS